MPDSNVIPLDRTPETVKIDNFLRRALKVRDPADPAQVAKALLDRYSGEAQNLRFEREGLPFQRIDRIVTQAQPPTAATPYYEEARLANDALEANLQALLSSSQLKSVDAELQGWARAIRSAAADGLDAARMALDSVQRDRAFSSKRLLNDYARLVRYVGALSAALNPLFRSLAQSIDTLAGLILVAMGDALSVAGRSSVLLQAPASALTERRDSILVALRTLTASTEHSVEVDAYPYGLVGYQQLLRQLDTSGQSDLRALLDENSLARILDQLIDLAAGNTPDGLRALGATAGVSLSRLRRLALFCNSLGTRQAGGGGSADLPPLATFVTAVNLFVDSFAAARSGARLPFIARPPAIFYGLFGAGIPDDATRRLLELVQQRGRLAELSDCFLECQCDPERVRWQVLLDKLVYDVDRAIDLYSLGSRPWGSPEIRAMAYGASMDAARDRAQLAPTSPADVQPQTPIYIAITAARDTLGWPAIALQIPIQLVERATRLMHDELALQDGTEGTWEDLVSALAPQCLQASVLGQSNVAVGVRSLVRDLVPEAMRNIRNLSLGANIQAPAADVAVPAPEAQSLHLLAQQALGGAPQRRLAVAAAGVIPIDDQNGGPDFVTP